MSSDSVDKMSLLSWLRKRKPEPKETPRVEKAASTDDDGPPSKKKKERKSPAYPVTWKKEFSWLEYRKSLNAMKSATCTKDSLRSSSNSREKNTFVSGVWNFGSSEAREKCGPHHSRSGSQRAGGNGCGDNQSTANEFTCSLRSGWSSYDLGAGWLAKREVIKPTASTVEGSLQYTSRNPFQSNHLVFQWASVHVP